MIYLILGAITIIISGISFLWIKKLRKDKKSLEFKLDYADTRIDFYQKNRQAYQSVIDKLMEKRENADEIKEKINNSDGNDLSDILNEL